MSLLLYNGEVIEIPEYIIRIVNRAQEIISSEENNKNIGHTDIDNLDLSTLRKDGDLEPTVIGPDGYPRTVSEYILEIIRTAQKIVQEDTRNEDDIKDYDEFIDSTFESMLNEIDSDSTEESSIVVQNVVEKLIDEVCSSKFTMPEMNYSITSTGQEDIPIESPDQEEQTAEFVQNKMKIDIENNTQPEDSTGNDGNEFAESDALVEVNSEISHADSREKNEVVNEKGSVVTEDLVKAKVTEQMETAVTEETEKEIVKEEKEKVINTEDTEKIKLLNNVFNSNRSEHSNVEEGTDLSKIEDSCDISVNELEKVAEKFVESICEQAKNELSIEVENKKNEIVDSNNDSEKCIENGIEDIKNNDRTDTGNKESVSEQTDGQEGNSIVDKKSHNHTDKVHPEENKPVITNVDVVSHPDSLPSEGKRGKEQKYDISKDKIKPKRRARGLRNSFRRMFSCFSTKSSQLE